MKKIAVIGGGVSGIATAFYLSKANVAVDLYEAEPVLGGRIASQKLGERWIDMGGKNIGLRYTHFRSFLDAIGHFEFEYFGLNSGQQIGNKIVTLNKDRSVLHNLLQVSRRIGMRGIHHLLRAAYCIYRDRDQGFLNTPFFSKLSERYDQHPLSHYFSPKTNDFLLRTLTVRMNGAEPDECYLGNFGANLNLLMDNYEQLKSGMHVCLEAFTHSSSKINVQTGCPVQSISCIGNRWAIDANNRIAEYDGVVLALPAQQAATLLTSIAPQASSLLKEIRYYPVATAVAEYEHDVFTAQNRAIVFPTSSPLSNAGAYGLRELNLVRYTFSGRTARAAFAQGASGTELIERAEKELSARFNIAGNRRKQHAYRQIPTGLCAYSAFHHRRLREIQNTLPAQIFLTGDYWRGVSIEACFRAAYEQTKKMISALAIS